MNFLLHFWHAYGSLNSFEKEMTRIGYVFPKLATAKDVVI